MFRQTQNQYNFQTVAAAESSHANPHVHFIEQVVDAVVGHAADAEATVDPDDVNIQQRMVEAVMQIDDDEIDAVVQRIFDRIPVDHQHRVERRIKFMIHPDKNTHLSATDAF